MISAFLAAIMLTCNLGLESYAMDSLKDAQVIAAESVSENTVSEEENIVELEENNAEETPIKEDTEESQETTMGVEDKEEEEADKQYSEVQVEELKHERTATLEEEGLLRQREEETEILLHVNPLYEGIIDVEDLKKELQAIEESYLGAEIGIQSEQVYETIEEAGEYVKQEMVKRTSVITVSVKPTAGNDPFHQILNAAMKHTEEGSGQEGDALRWVYGGCQGSTRTWGDQITITYTMQYYTTKEQEEQLTAKVNSIMNELNLAGKTDEEKVKAIHDKLCATTDYDYENLNVASYKLKYTAYAALCQGKAVCQGYAIAFYRLCKEAGLSVRVISGIGGGGGHAWNIVKVGDYYYNIDTTWDGQDSETRYSFYLQNEADFADHVRDNEYNTEEFHQTYPMARYSYGKETLPKLEKDNISRTFTTINDTQVSSEAAGNPKLLLFIMTKDSKSVSTIQEIAKAEIGDTDVLVIDITQQTKDTVTALKTTYANDNLNMTFCYDNTTAAEGYFWDYAVLAGQTDNLYYPMLFYIDGSNKLQYFETGAVTGTHVEDILIRTCQLTPELETYNLALDANGGDVQSESFIINENGTYPALPEASRKGYEFMGWFTQKEGGVRIQEGTAITKNRDHSLYAHWNIVTYTVEYHLNGGSDKGENPESYTIESETITLKNALPQYGESFEGWYKEENFETKVTEISKGSEGKVTLFARWKLEPPQFTISNSQISMGEKIYLTAARPEAKIYYTLDGSEPSAGTNLYNDGIELQKEATVRAIAVYGNHISSDISEKKYIPCTTKLVLDETDVELRRNETLTLNIQELPTGRTEEDITWTTENNKIVKVEKGVLSPVSTGSTTIKATVLDYQGNKIIAECKVTVLPVQYTVNFYNWEKTLIVSHLVEEGKSAEVPVIPERPGYISKGWDHDVSKVKEHMEVYPIYELITYSIRYLLDGEPVLSDNPVSYTIESEKILLKDPILNEGYEFLGWYKNEDLTGEKVTAIPKGNYGDKTYYAAIEYKEYTIMYHLNEGNNSDKNPLVYTAKDTIILEPAFGKSGYEFAGWYENEKFEGAPIERIESGRNGDIILYAKWKDERGLWMEEIAPLAYTGTKVQPEKVQVFYGGQELTQGTDYTISYKNNVNANDLSPEMLSKAPTVVIKGKGNYTGSVTKNFVIERKSLEDEDIIIDDLALAYKANKKQLPVPKVLWNKKSLANKKDFKITYLGADNPQSFVEPGEYKIRIEGINNYTGSREITLKIASTEEILLSKVKVVKIPNQIYDGNPVDVEGLLQLTYNKIPLVLNQDYELIYEPCIQAGSHTVVIVGKGVYKGTLRTTFNITGIPMNKVKVSIPASVIYNGENLTPDDERLQDKIVLTYSYKEGKETKVKILTPEDYEISCSKRKDKGTVQVTITGKNSYSGSIKKNVKIVAYEMKNSGITVDPVENIRYEKNGSMPKVIVKFKGEPLKENKDYKLSYKNNQNVNSFTDNKKDALVVITGMGNFSGKREVPFEIEPKDIATVNRWAADLEEAGAGKYISVPKLTDNNDKALSKGKDYEAVIRYYDEFGHELGKKDVLKAGRIVTAKVTGKGNYQGVASIPYRILEKKMSIAKASVTLPKGKKWYYTGEAITLDKKDITVKIGKETLGMDDFHIISYRNNTNKGTAKVTIEGLGRYGGRKEISFRIQSQTMKWWKNLAAK